MDLKSWLPSGLRDGLRASAVVLAIGAAIVAVVLAIVFVQMHANLAFASIFVFAAIVLVPLVCACGAYRALHSVSKIVIVLSLSVLPLVALASFSGGVWVLWLLVHMISTHDYSRIGELRP